MWADEAIFGLVFHILLYSLLFFAAAFWAARAWRRRNDPERKSLASMEGQPVEAGAGQTPEEDGICADCGSFVSDPLPFMAHTSDADDDTVLMKAGLDSLIYLHFMKSMLVFFLVLSALGVMVVLPLNLYSARKSWFDSDSFLISTANGFVGPSHSLVLHTMMSIFVAVAMMAVVYQLRQFLLSQCRPEGDNKDSTPPGLRLDPPVKVEELKVLAEEAAPGRLLSAAVALDVTDIVDRVERTRVLRKQLGRYRQQLENDKERPTMQTGLLRFIGCGNEHDAITYTEKEIDGVDKEVEKLRQTPGRIGTGTAFITFTKRPAAVAFIDKYKDPLKARKACGYPTIGKGADYLCENQNKWEVELAVKPEDIFWRNLRYSTLHRMLLTVAGFIFLVILFAFIVTPIFFVQIFLAVGDATVEEFDAVKGAGGSGYEKYYQGQADAKQFNRFIVGFLQFLWPFLVLIINFFIMPALVNYSAKFMGQRYVSSMQRTTFNLIFFFMVLNILIFPALALNGLDEFLRVTNAVPMNQILGQVLLYGSNTSFFVDYIAQSALLGSAFYFVFHTTTPMVSDWMKKGASRNLTWEFDFAYFYSSLLSILAIGFVFAVTVPLVLPCVLLFLTMRYYTDKWQLQPGLQTAHNTERVDPAPETTASAVLVAILVVVALSQAAFASWLSIQGAWNLAIWPWITAICLFAYLAIPTTRHKFVTVSNKWRPTKNEHPLTWETEAIPAYAGAYENPYLDETTDRASRLRGDVPDAGEWLGV